MSDLAPSHILSVSDSDRLDCMKNIDYVCSLTALLKKAFNDGNDIAHLPNGDVLVTETRIVHNHIYYAWDPGKGKLVESK